jgi:hypothetical protein
LRRLAQETSISKSSVAKVTKQWISTYLNGTESVCMYRDTIFSISFNIGKLILLLLWSDTWLVLGKSCSTWRWVMQFLPGSGIWELRVTMPVDALYILSDCSRLFFFYFAFVLFLVSRCQHDVLY